MPIVNSIFMTKEEYERGDCYVPPTSLFMPGAIANSTTMAYRVLARECMRDRSYRKFTPNEREVLCYDIHNCRNDRCFHRKESICQS